MGEANLRIAELKAGNVRQAAILYQAMAKSFADFDERLRYLRADGQSIDRQVRSCLGNEDDVFLLLFAGDAAVGFIDSSRIIQESGPAWFVKAAFAVSPYDDFSSFSKLESEIEERVRKKGIQRICCASLMDDAAANLIWKRAGFRIEGFARVKILGRSGGQ